MRKSKAGYVYLYRFGDFVKIGNSEDPPTRLAEFMRIPYQTEIIAEYFVENCAALEGAIHKRFAHLRVQYEWFSLGESDIAEIRQFIETTSVPVPAGTAGKSKRRLLGITTDLARKLKVLACFHGASVTETLEEILRPIIEERYAGLPDLISKRTIATTETKGQA